MVTEFQKKVYKLCRKIPKGKVSTYKDIGKALRKKGQIYRAVGNALNKNPFAPKVPCHRVVNANGSLGKFAHGVRKKISLLKKEGVTVKNGKIVDFKAKRVKKLK